MKCGQLTERERIPKRSTFDHSAQWHFPTAWLTGLTSCFYKALSTYPQKVACCINSISYKVNNLVNN
jgi:hypothetical protein